MSHQGTNTSSFSSILNDADFALDPVNSRLSYLGSVKVHGGFQDTWLRTADSVLAQVKSGARRAPGRCRAHRRPLARRRHLAARRALPQKAAALLLGQVRRLWPAQDGRQGLRQRRRRQPARLCAHQQRPRPVPRLPPAIDYQHASGEIWINPANSLSAVTCPGQENENCILSVNPFTYDVSDHTGTYFNVHIAGRGENCPAVIG